MIRDYTDDDIERVPEPDADAPYEDEDEEPGVFRFRSGEKFTRRIITLHGVETEFLIGESQSVEKLERQLMRSGYADQFLKTLENTNGGDGLQISGDDDRHPDEEDEEEKMYRLTKNAGPSLTGDEPIEVLVRGRRKGITKVEKGVTKEEKTTTLESKGATGESKATTLEKALRIARRMSSDTIGGPSPLDDPEEQEAEDREVEKLRSELGSLRDA